MDRFWAAALILALVIISSADDPQLPKFAESIPNVTASVGSDVLLPCTVDNLNAYKVAWVRADTQTILSIHHAVISQNPRISLLYNDHRSWYLQIQAVEESDRGWYMCQVNTNPMGSMKGYVEVVVPPEILDTTSGDIVVRESANVSMLCQATGYPEPYVMWRREDGEDIIYNGENVNVVDGGSLYIVKVSRLHMGAYLCIASNGVPPSVSKRIMLMVQFPPMLSIPNQLEGAYLGQDVTLGCHTEAYPPSINYWITDWGEMIISGDKYEAVSEVSGYNKKMLLVIRNVEAGDYIAYKCVVKNSLGETDGVIRLYEIPTPVTSTSTVAPSAMPVSARKKIKGEVNKVDRTANDYDAAIFRNLGYEYTQASEEFPSLNAVPANAVRNETQGLLIILHLATLAQLISPRRS